MEAILYRIIELLPSITAVLTLIASIMVSIHKFKTLNKDTIQKLDDLSSSLLQENAEVKSETKELRSAMSALMKENMILKAKIDGLTFRKVDHGESE